MEKTKSSKSVVSKSTKKKVGKMAEFYTVTVKYINKVNNLPADTKVYGKLTSGNGEALIQRVWDKEYFLKNVKEGDAIKISIQIKLKLGNDYIESNQDEHTILWGEYDPRIPIEVRLEEVGAKKSKTGFADRNTIIINSGAPIIRPKKK